MLILPLTIFSSHPRHGCLTLRTLADDSRLDPTDVAEARIVAAFEGMTISDAMRLAVVEKDVEVMVVTDLQGIQRARPTPARRTNGVASDNEEVSPVSVVSVERGAALQQSDQQMDRVFAAGHLRRSRIRIRDRSTRRFGAADIGKSHAGGGCRIDGYRRTSARCRSASGRVQG